jgi:hypothetical protein
VLLRRLRLGCIRGRVDDRFGKIRVKWVGRGGEGVVEDLVGYKVSFVTTG